MVCIEGEKGSWRVKEEWEEKETGKEKVEKKRMGSSDSLGVVWVIKDGGRQVGKRGQKQGLRKRKRKREEK